MVAAAVIAQGGRVGYRRSHEPERSRQLVRRIEFRHTPKQDSWLNIAENELSSLTRQYINRRRFADIETLLQETEAWSTNVNHIQQGVDWQMRIDDARYKQRISRSVGMGNSGGLNLSERDEDLLWQDV